MFETLIGASGKVFTGRSDDLSWEGLHRVYSQSVYGHDEPDLMIMNSSLAASLEEACKQMRGRITDQVFQPSPMFTFLESTSKGLKDYSPSVAKKENAWDFNIAQW